MSEFAKSPCCNDDIVKVVRWNRGKEELLHYECNKCGRKLKPGEFTGEPRVTSVVEVKAKLIDFGPTREPFYNEKRRLVRML